MGAVTRAGDTEPQPGLGLLQGPRTRHRERGERARAGPGTGAGNRGIPELRRGWKPELRGLGAGRGPSNGRGPEPAGPEQRRGWSRVGLEVGVFEAGGSRRFRGV